MTRINVIPVEELVDMHLRGEYKEIVRVFRLAAKHSKRVNRTPIPKEYVLGTGHVTFFYDKLEYITKRYRELTKEMIWRGFNVKPIKIEELLDGTPVVYYNDYTPTEKAIELNKQRIKERL